MMMMTIMTTMITAMTMARMMIMMMTVTVTTMMAMMMTMTMMMMTMTIMMRMERFSNETKTKAITPTNHDRGEQCDEPITIIPSYYLKLAQSVGKIMHTWRDWFWFCFSLAEKLA